MRTYLSPVALVVLLLLGAPVRAETPLEAAGPSGPLRGTLTTAAASDAPVVLIIPGSGPTDRDGNNRGGLQAATYRLIAEGLATDGIASVRIDKRGMYGSASAADGNAVTIGDYVTDVASWITAIRAATRQDCVWVLGHSEGGLVALAAAQKVANICGLLLVATPGRPLGDVLKEQLRSNPANAPILDQALSAIDRLQAGNRVDAANLHPALMPLFRPEVQGYLIDVFSYDPAKLVRDWKGPVLILQGTRDIQVGVPDAERLASANTGAKLLLLPAVNHVLKHVASDDRRENVATYANPGLPLADGVVPALVAFVRSHQK